MIWSGTGYAQEAMLRNPHVGDARAFRAGSTVLGLAGVGFSFYELSQARGGYQRLAGSVTAPPAKPGASG